MKTFLSPLFCLLMTAAPAPNSIAAPGCALKSLAPHGSTLTVGVSTINLGEADDPSAPTAWQGPLTAGTCSLEVGTIEQPMALTPSQLLYVTTYSGSLRTVALFDLNKCSVRWKSGPFGGKVAFTDSALVLGQKKIPINDQCLPKSGKKP
jgi:hypothetical protein